MVLSGMTDVAEPGNAFRLEPDLSDGWYSSMCKPWIRGCIFRGASRDSQGL